jgi:hypothetical protein
VHWSSETLSHSLSSNWQLARGHLETQRDIQAASGVLDLIFTGNSVLMPHHDGTTQHNLALAFMITAVTMLVTGGACHHIIKVNPTHVLAV